MKKIKTLTRRLHRNESGATAIEFAFVATIFFIMFMGIIEYGLFMVTQVALESAVTQAGRASAINTTVAGCPDRACAVKEQIYALTAGLVGNSNHERVIITSDIVAAGGTGGASVIPDICYSNGFNNPPDNPQPSKDTGCDGPFYNGGGGPGYDGAGGTDPGLSNQLVEIRATYPWHVFFPILKDYFGPNGVVAISSSTVVRNEDF